MESNHWLTLAIFIVGLIALIGFLFTKTKGFGPYATSTLLLILVLVVASLLYSNGKLSDQVLANLLFAIIGFAGGLFTCRGSAECGNSEPKKANLRSPERVSDQEKPA